jgi:hypothetical protein
VKGSSDEFFVLFTLFCNDCVMGGDELVNQRKAGKEDYFIPEGDYLGDNQRSCCRSVLGIILFRLMINPYS